MTATKRSPIGLTVLLPVLILAACGGESSEPAAMATAQPPDQEYLLGFGETIHVDSMTLEFTTLAEDSRCPASVNCVWQGNARVLVTATRGRAISVLELNTDPQFPVRAEFDGTVIELRKVDPYPATPSLPRAQDYTLTLFVAAAR